MLAQLLRARDRLSACTPDARSGASPSPIVLFNLRKADAFKQQIRRPRVETPHKPLPSRTSRPKTHEPSFQTAWSILQEPLIQPPATTGGSASTNDTHGLDEIALMAKERLSWQLFYPPTITHAYLAALQNPRLLVRRNHQQWRLLESEGDVADLVFYNILAPIADILNHLIAPKFHPYSSLEIQQQASTQVLITGRNKDGKIETKLVSLRCDHVLTLVDKRGWSTPGEENPKSKRKRWRLHLLNIEEKKVGLVDHRGWDLDFGEDNAKKLLPQPILYRAHFGVKRVLLTNYLDGVALHIEDAGKPGSRPAQLASHECYALAGDVEPVSVFNNPISLGLRHAACCLGMDALRELGILDYSLVNVSPAHRPPVQDALQAIINLGESQYRTKPEKPPPQPVVFNTGTRRSSRVHKQKGAGNAPRRTR